jgi:uncharacterized membrane protein
MSRLNTRIPLLGITDGEPKGNLLLLSWVPWVATAAGAGVILDGGMETVFGMEPRGTSVIVLLAAIISWFVVRRVMDRSGGVRLFAAVGTVTFTPVVIQTLRSAGLQEIFWLTIAVVGAVLLAGSTRILFARFSESTGLGYLGGFVVFAQAFDATTTAVGTDVLGYTEQTPLSKFVLTVARRLPLTELIGVGWIYILLKVALALSIVSLLSDDMESVSEPLALAVVAFAGFGPAVHNVVLYAIT